MAVFKCKMCGGNLEVSSGQSVITCEYCGNTNTIPRVTDESSTALYNRANELRMRCEFDQAEKSYESILENNPNEAEAHWGLCLCKFGIEYVDDPKTCKKIPTCHRASYESILADYDYQSAIKYADVISRPEYEKEARIIDNIQKEIVRISNQEAPYDVFICYKESGEDGKRTEDSIRAYHLYDSLTKEGYRVFYAAVSLEDKLGQNYEPIIFAALNSAKVMLVVGTKKEYFNAVWVRNEWSRFLKMMRTEQKYLIPCYLNINPYDMPVEFSHLQAQDLSKPLCENDIIRAIRKVIVKEKEAEPKYEAEVKTIKVANSEIIPLLERAQQFIEDGKWDKADEYCERVLDKDAKNAMAYVYKTMIDLKVKRQEDLAKQKETFDTNENYKKAIRFGDTNLKNTLEDYNEKISQRNEELRLSKLYTSAIEQYSKCSSEEDYKSVSKLFGEISQYKDSSKRYNECLEKAENARKEKIYVDSIRLIKGDNVEDVKIGLEKLNTIPDYKDSIDLIAKGPELCEIARKEKIYKTACIKLQGVDIPAIRDAIIEFDSIKEWKDSLQKKDECLARIEFLEKKAEKLRIEKERREREYRIAKEKHKKKVIVIKVLAFIMVAVIIALITVNCVNKRNDEELRNGITYSLVGGEYSVTGIGTNSDGVIEILSEYKGKPVTSIGSSAFEDCSSLTSVTIPNSVTSIGVYAFSGCSSLTSVTIPNSVTSIGIGAFSGCKSLTSVTIPNSVKSIGNSAFSGCTSLTSVTIPNSVESIGNYAFEDCSSLTNVTIGDSVTSIGEYAFDGCSSLTSVTIPDSVTSIGYSVFNDCSSLESVTIPNSVISIGIGAFSGCKSLTSVTIPNSVKSIGNSAFSGCTSLTSVTIPNSVESIGNRAFSGCPIEKAKIPAMACSYIINDKLKEVEITSGTSIGSSAFYNCSSLTNVTIGNSVTSIGSGAFSGCKSLEEITIPFVGAKAGVTNSDTYQYPFGYIFGTSSYTGGTSTKQYYYGYSTRSTTYDYYYIPSSLKKVTVTGGNILYGAFYNCSSLTSIEIPDGVTSIGDDAFYGCRGLTSIEIPDGVTSIGDDAFYGCRGLTSVTIPDSVTSIGERAFYNCWSLTSVTIPDSVTSIGNYAFEDCSSLTNVTIGDSVTSIGEYAFDGCISLTTVYWNATNCTSAGSYFHPIFSSYSKLTTIIIGDNVQKIPSYAFYNCSSLTNITISNSVTSIGDDAFYKCPSLVSVTYNGTKEQWKSISKGSAWISGVPSTCKVYCTDGELDI